MFLPKTLVLLAHGSRAMSKLSQRSERAELDFVPLKTSSGKRTALAEELAVELTPTLVVCHETISCEIDSDDEEYCELEEESVERFVGATAIIENLDATLDAYTYSHPE